MLVRVGWRFALTCLVVSSTGCGPSLANMSAGQIGCRPSDVSIVDVRNSFGARNWVARCGGAEFSCSQVVTGRGTTTAGTATSSYHATQVNCSPMGGYSSDAPARSAPPPAQSRSTSSSGVGSAVVKRGYDEGRHAHFVTGKFEVAHRLHVIISGAPKVSMGTISVTLSGATRIPTVRTCQALEVLINGEPMSTERNEGTASVDRVKIESRFEFSVFRPLAGRLPVFGVRACGTTWAFTPHQLEQLRALLAVYSDLATKVQSDTEGEPESDAIPAAAGQTAL